MLLPARREEGGQHKQGLLVVCHRERPGEQRKGAPAFRAQQCTPSRSTGLQYEQVHALRS